MQWLHELFADYGLVVLDMSHPELKAAFVPVMRKELLEQPSAAIVESTIRELETAGYPAQASPREINLFYLGDELRERIVLEEDGSYSVLNTDMHFTREELLGKLETHPGHFSPNVILRPLYQETILPNLAYIGGGGEIAYWLERKAQFAHFDINFPMLIRRNSALWVDPVAVKRINKLGFRLEDLFRPTDLLIREYVRGHADSELSLGDERKQLEALFDSIAEKAFAIQPPLKKGVLAEKTKQLKTLDNWESRLIREEKHKHETEVNQIRSIREKLFPEGGLQERNENFLAYYTKLGSDYFRVLLEHLHPLEKSFTVFLEGTLEQDKAEGVV